ncbi:outer membrane protein assembly factor BamB family protein [Janthinobacterium sp. LB3P112]|uniref:outer membrane protein assembly factor BamB family protein n=1 Tax=Janthinobacterium sp. LB3P112 TaxID=3424196 RepID=UPI003F26A1BB
MTITMQGSYRAAALPALMLALPFIAGCGGGGGLFGPEDRRVLQLSEVSSTCDMAPGENCTDVHVVVSSDLGERPLWGATASNGVTVFQLSDQQKLSENSWRFTFKPVPGLPPGSYAGKITLSPLNLIALKYNNLPESMPYKVTVAPLKGNLSRLAALSGAGDWEGTNGNAAHTGLVPVDLDAGKFSRRWTWEYAGGEKTYRMSPPVAANGLVYFSLEQSAADSQDAKSIIYTNTLTALSEHDSSEQWRTPQTLDNALSAPGVSGTRLAMAGLASVHTFDAVSGVKLATATQPQTNGILTASSPLTAPTLAGASVYVGGNNDVISAESTTGRNLWSASLGLSSLGNVDEWTPAVNASTVYSNTAGTLRAFNRADGAQQWSVAVPGQVVTGLRRSSLYQAPVLADAHSVLLLNQRLATGFSVDNSLTLVDTDSRQVRWSVNGQFTTQPVVAQGVLYVGNHATASLEARSLATGAVLWSWPLSAVKEERFGGDLIVTNKLLFIAGQKGTYALDLASQKTVWSFRLAGKLALSRNGVLYIRSVSDNGNGMSRVTAINLQ